MDVAATDISFANSIVYGARPETESGEESLIPLAPPETGSPLARREDVIDFSAEALIKASETPTIVEQGASPDALAGVEEAEESEDATSPTNLSDEEKEQVRELKLRDAKVRRHEAAHAAAAGPYANGGPQFEFAKGPDGRQYAVGGEVSIDVSRENTPEATVTKMQVVKRAVLAPAQPSGQDRAIFSAASRIEMEARREIGQQARDEQVEGAAKEDEDEEGLGSVVERPALPPSPLGQFVPPEGPSVPAALDIRA